MRSTSAVSLGLLLHKKRGVLASVGLIYCGCMDIILTVTLNQVLPGWECYVTQLPARFWRQTMLITAEPEARLSGFTASWGIVSLLGHNYVTDISYNLI